ncbi:23S rRNA (adenine(2030)-N(6))-methyltransferase RlmJ [Pararhizobium mangrovi]|uniref:Ribosomal RNA large subunit methyltransferase J n=1 Tax=Pararhizobium mangrovi TaxID=2590452 RepID=A0A506UCA8_9HYPH|nr:23S rRNA (adenine(2030)-N(6))-methyltransferase RlmJ [Pararhizobium mangrovi]TPW32063.1 23S rRNA (adenine(2030)-N(6))-methyltransferase RlmJ [Pararhizobium mangrovi]
MNYRHVYHAGNFADVLKHLVLARVVRYLQRKEKPFRILDTHAGCGRYDLTGEKAQRTGEWREGIGRLMTADLPAKPAELAAPYLDVVRGMNPTGAIEAYPGSPLLARRLMRTQDRLSAIELHPEDFAELQTLFDGDHHVRTTKLDGFLALGGHVPFKERRGLVLIDPPFEDTGEVTRMLDGVARALRRFPGGTYCLWYPLKTGEPARGLVEGVRRLAPKEALRCELSVRTRAKGLDGSGLLVVNPPFVLAEELGVLLPAIVPLLAQDETAGWRVEELVTSR